LNFKIAPAAVFAQTRFHLSSSTLVALLRKVSLLSQLPLAQNPRYEAIL